MRKSSIWIVSTLVIAIMGFFLVKISVTSLKPYQVTSSTVSAHQTTTNSANMYQNNACVDIFLVNDTLYYYIENWPGSLGVRSRFTNKICTIGDGKINILCETSKAYGNDNRFLYYETNEQLIAYDTKLQKTTVLTPLTKDRTYDVTLKFDGSLMFSAEGKDRECFTIKKGTVIDSKEYTIPYVQYELGGKQYYIKDMKVYCQDEDISELFGPASFRAILPYQEGLLLINDGYGNLLYYIQKDGTIHPVFPKFLCMSSCSSINFYEHYIFVSFIRWESYDQSGIGLKRFKNDSMEGTYRIDIRDFSIEKISENIYNGMYIFDDSGIYTCNRDGDISKINFSGETLQFIVD